MTASVRSVNVDSVNRLVEAVRIADGFDMEKILRAASDIGGSAPETDRATNLIVGRKSRTIARDSRGFRGGWA